MDNGRKELLDIELIEAVALLTALSQDAARYLQQEVEAPADKWRQKAMHMRAIKHLSEALEVMAVNPAVHTIKEWIVDYENKRGAEWCDKWSSWFWDTIEQSVMYALYTTGR